ncbi:MAG: histidine ammonia-lyase [Peptostreptococcaceae bacterium]|nr:histidine ammonia-lyase [Peptostreptococcaceae bacterium]
MNKVVLTHQGICLKDVIDVAKNGYILELSEEVKNSISESRKIVDDYVAQERVVYGITTGFGKFSDVFISKEDTGRLQTNLIVSHACGVGEPFPEHIVRAIMMLRLNALSRGLSGIRLSTVEQLLNMINKHVHPVIPEKGSLGASGDLAPLSHMVLTMLGLGEAFYEGKRMSSAEALKLAGMEPIELSSKEGLALINGTQVMTAVGCFALYQAQMLAKQSDINVGLTMEALEGISDAFDPRIHEARGQKGQIATADNVLRIIENSQNITRQGEKRVQDAYAIRCSAQVIGATKDALEYVKQKIEIEINAVTDNPLIFKEDDSVISGGNFHGQPMALPMDFLAIAIAELANISERRLERLVNPALSNGLPAFLAKDGGLNSGFMIVQYSAAALVSENKILAHPASVDSIPSSANQEDHVSMGTIAARKALEIAENTKNVLAMELMGACQGIDLRGSKPLGKGSEAAYRAVREKISLVEKDRVMYTDIDRYAELLDSRELIEKVERAVGEIRSI